MGKIIEKKVRKSLPVLVMICLVSLAVGGFSFNLNFDWLKINQKGFLSVEPQAAKADTATTTVSVKNAPPMFTVGPTENPTSTSTSPVNVGASIGFQGTGNDGESNDYWLLVCSGNRATSTIGNPPTCVASTQFCISNKASSSVSTSCTYSSVTDPGSETQAWYAFVCDDNAGDPSCSAASQGTGNGGSPFYVNHGPRISRVYTSVDNQDPGGTFTIFASSTDSDVMGGVDDLEMYACSTNSWTVLGGCGATTLCMGTSTTPDVSCNYIDTAPTPHGAYSYYVFLKDWHNLASTHGNGTSSSYTVNNVAPAVSNVSLNRGQNISLNIKGAADIIVRASSTSVTDNNGCTDLVSATSTIYLGTVAGGADCTANNNNCYRSTSAFCSLRDCSGSDDATATYVCSTTMAFYTIPTDADSAASTTSWYARITASDATLSGSGSYTTLNGVEVVSTAALAVNENNIAYGTVQAGGNTGSVNATTTIVNYGNTPIRTDVTGDDMLRNGVGPAFIGIENQQHSLVPFAYGAGTNTSSTTADTVATDIGRPTSATDVSDQILWGIAVPFATPSDLFRGTNTFTVVEYKYGTWNYP